jgi:hypothetical protein
MLVWAPSLKIAMPSVVTEQADEVAREASDAISPRLHIASFLQEGPEEREYSRQIGSHPGNPGLGERMQ